MFLFICCQAATDRRVLTDSLHLPSDSSSYFGVSSLLQCNNSGALQLARWDGGAELQQHTAGGIPANDKVPNHCDVAKSEVHVSSEKYLLTCFYLGAFFSLFSPSASSALQDTSTTWIERERERILAVALWEKFFSEKWNVVACLCDILTLSFLSHWQTSRSFAGWRLHNVFDSWVKDGETEADWRWYCLRGDGSWHTTVPEILYRIFSNQAKSLFELQRLVN